MDDEIRDKILKLIPDLVLNFTYYDRKECSYLSLREIEKAIERKLITADEIAEAFKAELQKVFK